MWWNIKGVTSLKKQDAKYALYGADKERINILSLDKRKNKEDYYKRKCNIKSVWMNEEYLDQNSWSVYVNKLYLCIMAVFLNAAFQFLYIDTITACHFDGFNLIQVTLEERLHKSLSNRILINVSNREVTFVTSNIQIQKINASVYI
jgi:hypothetical protein